MLLLEVKPRPFGQRSERTHGFTYSCSSRRKPLEVVSKVVCLWRRSASRLLQSTPAGRSIVWPGALAIFHSQCWDGSLVGSNLQTRTPQGKIPTERMKLILSQTKAVERIEGIASMLPQPTVCLLCGDFKLNQDQADVICQIDSGPTDVNTCLYTDASMCGNGGDVCALGEGSR